jgi:hypothetical protein
VSRRAELEARRRLLLARCEAQRLDLARRFASLRSIRRGFQGLREGDEGQRASRHPLAWIAALAGLTLLGRTRDVLTLLAWARTALSIASRAAQLLSFVGEVRTRRAGRRAARAARA